MFLLTKLFSSQALYRKTPSTKLVNVGIKFDGDRNNLTLTSIATRTKRQYTFRLNKATSKEDEQNGKSGVPSTSLHGEEASGPQKADIVEKSKFNCYNRLIYINHRFGFGRVCRPGESSNDVLPEQSAAVTFYDSRVQECTVQVGI